jgi:SAM-dependent methyltransferase
LYSTDLAHIHDTGFGDFAERAAPEVIRMLRRHGIRPGSGGRAPMIVDIGCGSGTVARRLVDARYDVVGFDISRAMIQLARRKVPEARFRVASLADARLPRCNAVIAIGEVITYVPARGAGPELPHALRAFLRRGHDALEPGGVLIFDFIESGARRTYPVKSRSGRNWVIAAQATLDPSGTILTRRIVTIRKVGRQFRRTQEYHRVRIYSRRAVARALTAAGFTSTMSRSYGRLPWLPGNVVVVAKK